MTEQKNNAKKLEKFLEKEGFIDWSGGKLPEKRLYIDFSRNPEEMVVYVKKLKSGKIQYKIYEREK